MHADHFIQDLAMIMLVAGVVTILFHRMRQPVVLGYLLAGLIVGPHTPPYPLVTDVHTVEIMAELGMVFLMFSLGLEFSLGKLIKVGPTALVAAVSEIMVMGWVGFMIGRYFGWSTIDSIFLGAMLSMSSTTIIVKALDELKLKEETFAQLVFGVLIVEDILGIVMIALLSGVAKTGTISLQEAAWVIAGLVIFLITSLVVGFLLVPRLIGYVAKFERNEMLLVTVLGLCFGYCMLVTKIGYSIALGAFIMGAIIAEAREVKKIEHLIEPIRDMFSAVFFVAIGMLINPAMLWEYRVPIVVITVAVVVCKVITCTAGTFMTGRSPRESLRVGMSLAQIGEFSFIIASFGLSLKVTGEFLYPIAVAVSVITTLLTPYMIRSSDGVGAMIGRKSPPWLSEYLNFYALIVGSFSLKGEKAAVVEMFRSLIWKIVLNICLVIAVFAIFGFLSKRKTSIIPDEIVKAVQIKNVVLWSAAMLISLPFLIVAFQKVQVLGRIIVSLSLPPSASSSVSNATRSLIAKLIGLATLTGFGIMILIPSSAMLPSMGLLGLLLALFVLIAWAFRQTFSQVHARLQNALSESMRHEE